MLVSKLASENRIDHETPSWVDSRNVSFRAWQCMLKLFEEKRQQILTSSDLAGMSAKRDYQISQREIAQLAGFHPSTMHNRHFTCDLKSSLSDLNKDLLNLRNDRYSKLRKVGMKDKRKSEIVEEVRRLARSLEKERDTNIKEIVEDMFASLPLRARRVLMLE